jgi:hypothetical protein
MRQMNTQQLHAVLRQFRGSFLTFFSALTEQDYQRLLEEESERLLALLQQRYGYTRSQAKSAWNEFVLRQVDGSGARQTVTRPFHGPVGGLCPGRTRVQQGWWRPDQRKAVPTAGRRPPVPVYH